MTTSSRGRVSGVASLNNNVNNTSATSQALSQLHKIQGSDQASQLRARTQEFHIIYCAGHTYTCTMLQVLHACTTYQTHCKLPTLAFWAIWVLDHVKHMLLRFFLLVYKSLTFCYLAFTSFHTLCIIYRCLVCRMAIDVHVILLIVLS